MSMSHSQKLIFLTEINNRKQLLFGSFNEMKDGKKKLMIMYTYVFCTYEISEWKIMVIPKNIAT